MTKRLMTAEGLAEYLDVSALIAAGYTIEIRSAAALETAPQSYTYEIVWKEYPLDDAAPSQDTPTP